MTRDISKAGQEANRLAMCSRDMREVIFYLTAYKARTEAPSEARDSKIILNALAISALVVYARSFMTSYAPGKATSSVKHDEWNLWKTDNTKRALHLKVIDQRGSAAAHAPWTKHQSELISVIPTGVTTMSGSEQAFIGGATIRTNVVPAYLDGIDVEEFLQLAKYVEHVTSQLHMQRDLASPETDHARNRLMSGDSKSKTPPDSSKK